MSALDPHIRVLRALAEAFHGQALEARKDAQGSAAAPKLQQCAYFAAMIRDGCHAAADQLEAEQCELEAKVQG